MERKNPFFLILLGLLFGLLWTPTIYGQSTSGVSPNVLVLPKGPGSLGGIGENVSANLNMGLMNYPIKVIFPEGRGKFTPSVGISYSSSAGSGVMGIGWSISAGDRVERLTVRGLPQYDNTDLFYGGAGELVKIPSSTFYRPRVEGSFVRYRWHQTNAKDQRGYWTAEYPNGEKAYFGADSTGTVDLSSQVYGLKGTFRWELRTRVDRNGNRIEYHYFRDKSQIYLERIEYVFDTNKKPLYAIKFKYEKRPDFISDGKPGFNLETTQRASEIEITSSNQRIRSYKFKFDESSGLSRLIQVTRYGIDPKKAHPIQFSIKYSDATFSPTTSRMVTMPTSLGINFSKGDAGFIDMNGDGLPDVVNSTGAKHRLHMNALTLDKNLRQATHDFPKASIVEETKSISAKLSNPSVQLLDFNGDGFTDLVDAVNWKIYLNKGNSKWEDKSATLAKSFPITRADPNMRFFDYNGDKAIDVVRSIQGSTTYWISDGKGNWKKVDAANPIGASFTTDRLRLIDMNGDGLSDAVRIIEGTLLYKKYFGYGVWSSWIKVPVQGLKKEHAAKAQFADINGDGLADMVVFLGSSIMYFVNRNGYSFKAGQNLQKFKGADIPDSTQNSIRIADLNGNGSRDIVWINASGKVTYLELFSERPNLLKSISNGIGQRIELTYGSSVYHRLRDESCDPKKDKACAGPWKNKLPMPFTVVNVIKTWAERTPGEAPEKANGPRTQRIFYHHGFYDGKEKKFRGFRRVQSLHEGDDSAGARQDENVYDVGDKDPYFHGKLLSSVVSDGKTHTYHKLSLEWKDCGTPKGAASGLSPPVRFICMASQEKQVIEGQNEQSKWRTIRNEFQYDGYGNLVLSSQLGQKDKDNDEKFIKKTYITPKDPLTASKWFLRLLQHSEICATRSGPCAKISYYYDGEGFKGLPSGQFTKGNLTRTSAKATAGGKEVHLKRKKYDKFGNVIELKDPNGNLRTVAWDSRYHLVPITEKLHVGSYSLSMSTLWDLRYSIVRQSTDFGGQVTQYGYDNFGRLKTTFFPMDDKSKPSVRYEYDLKNPLNRIITYKRSKTAGDEDHKTIVCYDGLGRKLQERTRIKSGRYLVTGFVRYNRLSQVAQRWNTFESDKEDCAFAPPKEVPSSSFYYDGLGRSIRAVRQDNSTRRVVYEPFKSLHYDEEDNKKGSPHFDTPVTLLKDGLGRVIEKIEIKAPGQSIRTRYQWSFINITGRDITTVLTDGAGNQKKQEIDLLGRITKVIDPDRKSISYTYDDANNLLTRKDEQGRTVIYTYDGLNRIKTIQQEGKDETRIQYFYDLSHKEYPGSNLKGKLTALIYPGGKDFFSYNANGQLQKHQRHLLGAKFDFGFRYDQLNRLLEKTYPDGRKVSFQYDGANRVTAIAPFSKEISYGKSGLLAKYVHTNDIEQSVTYNTRHQIQRMTIGGGKVADFQYTYDAIGNIKSIDETYGQQQGRRSFDYNALYQLTKATLGSEVLTYKYDQIGNILSKSSSLKEKSVAHVGAYLYDPNRPRAVVKAGPRTFTYDKAGRILTQAKMKFESDYLGRRTQTLLGGKVQGQYWYGPALSDNGAGLSGADNFLKRTLKMENAFHTLYVSEDYEVRDGKAIIYGKLGQRRMVAWSSTASLHQVFDDLAPASGDKKLTAKPDKKINAADAWLYHAARTKQLDMSIKSRPIKADLSMDMLRHSVERLLNKASEQKHFYHHNYQGSTVALTDESGKVISRKHYYPFGAIKSKEGDIFSYGYTGLERDALTKHSYAHTRYLDTTLGRWMSADRHFDQIKSINDEWNSYWYVSNNPLSLVDSEGTMSKKAMGAMIAFGAIGAASGALWLAGTLEAGPGNGFTANIIASTVAAAAGVLGAVGLVSKKASKAGGVLAIGSGVAWAVATFQSANGDHSSQGSVANYVASGLSMLAGTLGLAAVYSKNKKTSARLGIGAGVAALGSGIAWAVGTDTSSDGGVSNMIGAGLSIAVGLAAIAYGVKDYRSAARKAKNLKKFNQSANPKRLSRSRSMSKLGRTSSKVRLKRSKSF